MDAGVDGGVLDCLVGNGGCDSNALCSGPAGSVTCACNSGWSGNGQSCVDVDECLTANGGCDANASCANTPGSRTCTCRPGFSGSGLTCTSTSDTCTNAITLVFDGGLNATATGSTFGLADDATSAVPSCGVFTSPDAVYRFTTSAAAQLTVNLTTTTPGYEPELSLRTICNSNANEVCTRAPGPGKPVNLFVSSLPAGNYALWVDGASGSSGTYAVNLQLAPVSLSPPSNALCSAAKVLASGPVQVGGTTIGAPSSYGNDTFSMTCRNNGAITGTPGAPGPDVVFDWTADATRTYSIVIEPFPGFDVVGWVTQAPVCAGDGGSCIAGADNNGPGGETFTLSADAGTRYFIIVDGYNPGDQGDFSLSIR